MDRVGSAIWSVIFMVILFGFAFILPAALTIWNLYNLFAKRMKKPKQALVSTMVIGLLDYCMLYTVFNETAGDYDAVINTLQKHYSICSEYSLSFALPLVLGFVGLLVIGCISAEKLSPLVSAIASACVVLANIVGTFFAIQIWEADSMPVILLFYLFHLNMFVLSVSHIHTILKEHVRLLNDRKTVFRYGWMLKLYPLICRVSQMRAFFFLMIFPVAGLLEIILILFGQGPGGVVKAFTMTADWTFSTQIPPPPVEYEGHYLCTVAAGGHRRVVKPFRFGMRRGAVIIVNRQLCIANAFEDLLQERVPAFHRRVRGFYDRHGYPVSQVITTPLRADIIYILMKPLEWVFLMVLYLFDTDPEKRIAEQYKWEEGPMPITEKEINKRESKDTKAVIT